MSYVDQQTHTPVNAGGHRQQEHFTRARKGFERTNGPKLRIELPPIERIRKHDSCTVKEKESPLKRSSSTINSYSESPKRRFTWLITHPDIRWIKDNLELSHLKPVLRCAIAAWISALLVVIPGSERFLGSSSFLIMVASFLSPPSDPFVAVLEREIIIQIVVVGAYAWSCLGIKLASLARSNFVMDAIQSDIDEGRYIELAPSAICAVFLCLGTSILLFTRARMGQGKPILATFILACTAMDGSLTMAALYPYPTYVTGKAVVIPIAFHSVIAILSSLVIFPDSVHTQFRRRFRAVCIPLARALRSQPDTLNASPASPSFRPEAYDSLVWEAESGLGPLLATGRLMKKDFSYGRFSARDFEVLHDIIRQLTIRANGMAFYFKILDPARHKYYSASCIPTPLTSPILSPASTPPLWAPTSTPAVFDDDQQLCGSPSSNLTSPYLRPLDRRRKPGGADNRHFHPSHIFRHPFFVHAGSSLHFQLFPDRQRHHESSILGHPPENAVGVFESQRFLNLESKVFSHPDADNLLSRMMSLLADSASDLLRSSADTLEYMDSWLKAVPTGRSLEWLSGGRVTNRPWSERVVIHDIAKEKLQKVLDHFREEKRSELKSHKHGIVHLILGPYRSAFSAGEHSPQSEDDSPPHRYLFQCYLYQYHLMLFACQLLEMLEEIDKLECKRQRRRLWLPILPLKKLFSWSSWEPTDANVTHDEDEDPDTVIGIDPNSQYALERPSRRDPDALPPTNNMEAFGNLLYCTLNGLRQGNAQFALKAGVFAALLSLPAFLKQSAHFAVTYRYIWAIVLGQTTLSRFRGDTTFGLIARIISTFLGGVVGMIMWYVSTGRGTGNAFGLAAVTAVCYPFFAFARIYYPGPPIRVVFFVLTAQLVIAYSWQDSHSPSASAAGWGFHVAWRRFLLVTIGVSFASIFSFIPPSRTLRRHLRTTYATTVDMIGQLYCEVVSHAMINDETMTAEIARDLGAIRMKLKRSRMLGRNVFYEISMRGKWPAARYRRILELQMEIAYLLSHLRSVVDHLDPAWSKAFLRRTRFLEPDFQGDVLAVISMISTALRTGTPLPQITPCPLLDRFISLHPGLNVLRVELEDDYGLPQNLTIETLKDERYLYFSVGVATAFGIVTRLDSLMIATKELVGEHYHIRGLPVIETSKKRHDFDCYSP